MGEETRKGSWLIVEVIGVNDDEILAMDLDEIIKRFKELGGWTYRSSNLDMVFVVYMIARAVEKIAYAKGLKKGKSIGSHQAYNHFVKHGYWQESQSLDDCFWICSCCRFPSQASAAPQLYKYCPFCGAKMDGDKNAID